ncbi:hypothetical protein BWQ96_03155 [Gracilariopsis chorda]|uniref:Uncharacterized protein n=1 Tax=Gracilariopsis chorda TaxID=448386 RepID=A0A2V3IY48_9FLOR|nr:hypothetical protein BWQ96_03155 [Gracilariopsis chorda]|eukprot:PXF47078.1 hypothetical protein BWQ96_03155 [Gracilariopsis chorda]
MPLLVDFSTAEDYIIDLVFLESDTEDEDYERRRKAVVPSLTREIAESLQQFYKDVNRYMGVPLSPSTP